MEKNIKAPRGNAAGRDLRVEAAPAVQIQSITGGTPIIGTNGNVHVHVSPSPPQVRNIIQPGPEHITDEQKLRLHDLHREWVALHAAIKKTPLTYAAAWIKINRSAGVTTLHRIRSDRFDDAVAFVQREMAKLRNMKSAPAKDTKWRANRIGAIKARCTHQLGSPDAYKPYIKKNFGADSLTALATDELQRTYAYIFSKKVI